MAQEHRRNTSRLFLGLIAAGLVSVSLASLPGPVEAICAAYKPDDPEYWVFFCYLADPPKATAVAPYGG